jgi:putative endopeptidase
MTDNIVKAFHNRLTNSYWLSDITKYKAIEKLHNIEFKIGCSNYTKNYDDLKINNDFLANIIEIRKFNCQQLFNKLSEKPNRNEWVMNGFETNACYHPSRNEIILPAGILSKNFYDNSFSIIKNYARLGSVIGHEIIHGFDD